MLLRSSKIDISPKIPTVMAGFSRRLTPHTQINDPIEANIIVLEEGDKKTLILSLDVLFVTDALKETLLRIAQLYGIEGEKDFLLAASHTHFAPSLETQRPLLGTGTPEYYDWLIAQLSSLIANCFKQTAQEVTLSLGISKANHTVNRRRKTFIPRERKMRINMLPNYAGYKDESLYSLVFNNTKKETLAVLWSYSCHPVSFPNITAISADYIGICRDKVRKDCANTNLPVVFLQGFAGNIRATPPKKQLGLYSKIRLLFKMPIREDLWLFSNTEFSEWANSLAHFVSDNIKSAKTLAAPISIANSIIVKPLKAFGIHSAATEQFFIQSLSFNNIVIIALSAEVAAEYTGIIKQLFPNKIVLPVGYINTAFGYLPTSEILEQGGYEATESFESFAISGVYKGNPVEVLKSLFNLSL